MITKKFEFTLATRYIGSGVSEIVEIQFDDDATEDEIDAEVNEVYNEWLGSHNQGG